MADNNNRERRKAESRRIVAETHLKKNIMKQIKVILKKVKTEQTTQDKLILSDNPDMVKTATKLSKLQQYRKRRESQVTETSDSLESKCDRLSELIRTSSHCVIYTGAGISTAANVPDYRGPIGVWTLLQKGISTMCAPIVDSTPTVTHRAIVKLHQCGLVKHVVSQNCDGLHLRSGLPQTALSEIHGNMYIEVCTHCEGQRQYVRCFDVTSRTALRRHETGRQCHTCQSSLIDSVVHFGESNTTTRPQHWTEAVNHARKTDLIICVGSSLKVLKSYKQLWGMDKQTDSRPKLCIVNLQWTPKDNQSTLKLNYKCDDVLMKVMEYLKLQIPDYVRDNDPLFKLSTPLHGDETPPSKQLSHDQCDPEGDTRSPPHPRTRSESTGDSQFQKNNCFKQTINKQCLDDNGNIHHGNDHPMTSSSLGLQTFTTPLGPGWFGKGLGKMKRRRVKQN